MSTLANVTQNTRLILKIIALGSVFFVIVFLIFQAFLFLRNTFFPPTLPPPAQEFGKIPNLEYETNQESISYTINTVSGNLPDAPDRMTVYKIQKPSVNLLSLDSLRSRLEVLGFTDDEKKISDTKYEWSNSERGTTIRYDLANNDFDIISSQSAQENLALNFGFNGKNLVDIVPEFLSSLEINTSDINFDESKKSYFVIGNGKTTPISQAANSNLVKIDLFQTNVENYPIYYPNPSGSNMYFDLVDTDRKPEIVSSHFASSLVDKDNHSSYPIKTPEEALRDLKEGNGLIYNENNAKSVDILDISRGYFLNDGNNEYLIPIYIFKGNNFLAYIPAIKD